MRVTGRPPRALRSGGRPEILLTLTTLALAAFGGCATGPTDPDDGEPDPTGRISVTVTGLPPGAAAAVTVTGPGGFSRSLSADGSFDDVATGSYTVAAQAVLVGSIEYLPSSASQSASVTDGSTATVEVAYVAQVGRLAVTIDGLPDGVEPDVLVSGPNGFEATLTGSQVLDDVPAGDYTVVANFVSDGSEGYSGTEPMQDVAVTTGDEASVSVTYGPAPTTGTMALTVAGLPSGLAASFTVLGPNGFDERLTESTTLADLEPGSYSITTHEVTGPDQRTYGKYPDQQTVAIEAGGVAMVDVDYDELLGQLTISVQGLPSGQAGNVRLTGGPDGIDVPAGVHTGMPTGEYTITAGPVQQGGTAWWDPDPESQTVTIEAQTGKSAVVTYSPRAEVVTIDITINGLPAGVDANVTVVDLLGPTPYEESVTESRTITDLPRITGYRVIALGVESGGTTYAAQFNLEDLFFAGTDVETVVVDYQPFSLTPGTGVVAAAWSDACALDAGGLPYCWGGGYGSETPTLVAGAPALASIEVTAGFACGLTSAGAAWCWGDGFLGDGSAYGTTTPAPAGDGRAFSKLVLSTAHACGIDLSGAAWCWGANNRGQLGDGNFSPSTPELSPVAVGGGHTFTDITVSEWQSCAVDAAGDAWCWGMPPAGPGANDIALTNPTAVGAGGDGFARIDMGENGYGGACALRNDGSYWCFGYGSPESSGPDYVPMRARVQGGGNTPCRIRRDDRLECHTGDWELIAALGTVVEVDVGAGRTCALTESANVYCWSGDAEPVLVFTR